MLAKKNRLSRAELTVVRELGKLFSSSFFTGLSFYLHDGRPARAGVVVSTRVAVLATRRNRLRRIYYSLLGKGFLELEPGWLILLLAKKTDLHASQELLAKEIEQWLRSFSAGEK